MAKFASIFFLGTALSILLILTACTTTFPTDLSVSDYHVKAGDMILVKLDHYPSLEQSLMVRQDGSVSPAGIGKLAVAGLSSKELKLIIQRKYMEILPEPDVHVAVLRTSNLSVYIGGEIKKPGKIPFRPDLSVMEGITLSGGFRDRAKSYQIIIFRDKGKLGIKMYHFYMKNDLEFINGKFKLEPYDVIIITKKKKKFKSTGIEI